MATEVAQLLAVLTAALSADAATRVPAEETIQDASGRQGYLEALLQVIGGAAPTGATQLPFRRLGSCRPAALPTAAVPPRGMRSQSCLSRNAGQGAQLAGQQGAQHPT